MVRSALKALALVAALAAVGVVADGPPPPPPYGDGPPPPPKGDGPPPPPKGDGPPPPPKGDHPPPPPKGDHPPPPKPTDEVVHWGDWPAGCTPIKFEPYVCDDDYGKEYTTTYTEYPHDCTLYYEKPTPTPHKEWSTWSKVEDPKTWSTWASYDPPKSTWAPYDPPKSTWAPYDPPKSTWEPYYPHPHPYPPKPTDPAKWDEWEIEKKIVIITIIEEYSVPCETGWAKETTTIYTTHCGCEETPVPVHPPYKTYTTECPESWGVGKTVTVVVPEPTWTPAPTDYTWLEWAKPTEKTPVEDYSTSTWAAWTSTYPVADTKTETWSTWYSSSYVKPDVAKPTAWSPVASWTGAASSSAVSKVMVVAAGAFAGLALFL